MRRISYILLLGILLSACQKNTKSKGTNLPVEVISPIKKTETGRSREYTFLSRPYNETVLSFRINGPVLNFDLRPGQAFSKDSTILSIDNRDFLIRKQQTEALYSQTNQEYKRIEALYKKNNISGSNYEKAKADFLVAKSNYETAVNALSDTHLSAPYDGYIQNIHIEPFQDVKATEPILTFIELDRLKIETYIPEEVALHLYDKEKQKLCQIGIHFDTAPERTITPSDLYVSKSTTNNNLSSADRHCPKSRYGMAGRNEWNPLDRPTQRRAVSKSMASLNGYLSSPPKKEIMYGWLKETRLTPFPSNSVSKEITR